MTRKSISSSCGLFATNTRHTVVGGAQLVEEDVRVAVVLQLALRQRSHQVVVVAVPLARVRLGARAVVDIGCVVSRAGGPEVVHHADQVVSTRHARAPRPQHAPGGQTEVLRQVQALRVTAHDDRHVHGVLDLLSLIHI